MVSALDSEASGLCLNPGRGHYAVFLARKQFTVTVYYHSASLHPGV